MNFRSIVYVTAHVENKVYCVPDAILTMVFINIGLFSDHNPLHHENIFISISLLQAGEARTYLKGHKVGLNGITSQRLSHSLASHRALYHHVMSKQLLFNEIF